MGVTGLRHGEHRLDEAESSASLADINNPG